MCIFTPLYFKVIGGAKKSFKAMGKDMDMKVSISLVFQLLKEFTWKTLYQWTDDRHWNRALLLDTLIHGMETRFLKVTIYSNNFKY